MNDKILTIIIPSYNMEAYLNRCLSSLIVESDKMPLFEALIINDGSKDKTSEIGHSYENRYPGSFRVIDKENGHYGSCVNAGLAEAKGKYVKVLDADDYFGYEFADFLQFLESTDADIVLTDNVTVNERGCVIHKLQFDIPRSSILPVTGIGLKDSHLNHFNITYKTAILKESGYRQTEGISYTDLEWTTIPLCHVHTAIYCPLTVYYYFRGREGQTVDIEYRKNNMWMENEVVLELVKWFEEVKKDLDPGNVSVVKTCVSSLARQIYFHYLIRSHRDLPESDLLVFDKDLLSASGEIYDEVAMAIETRKFGKFRYISDFRKNGSRKGLKFFYYDICMAISNAVKNIRKK